jgi:hypothetical protein
MLKFGKKRRAISKEKEFVVCVLPEDSRAQCGGPMGRPFPRHLGDVVGVDAVLLEHAEAGVAAVVAVAAAVAPNWLAKVWLLFNISGGGGGPAVYKDGKT